MLEGEITGHSIQRKQSRSSLLLWTATQGGIPRGVQQVDKERVGRKEMLPLDTPHFGSTINVDALLRHGKAKMIPMALPSRRIKAVLAIGAPHLPRN